MSDLPTVVACVDDSDSAARLVEVARAWARPQAGGRFYAAHAVAPPPAPFESLLYPLACLGDDREAIEAELLALAATALGRRLRDSLPRDNVRFAWGAGVDAILGALQGLGPDLLVVGAGASRRATAGVVGPTATELLRRAPCATLVVPPQTDVAPPGTIVLALDLAPGSAALLTHALRLAADFGGRVHPVVVAPLSDVHDHAGLFGTRQGDPLGRPRKEAQRLFTALLDSTPQAFPIERQRNDLLAPIEVRAGDPGAAILEFARELKANVVVTARTRLDETSGKRLGRTAEYFVRHADMPVLVCPPAAVEPG